MIYSQIGKLSLADGALEASCEDLYVSTVISTWQNECPFPNLLGRDIYHERQAKNTRFVSRNHPDANMWAIIHVSTEINQVVRVQRRTSGRQQLITAEIATRWLWESLKMWAGLTDYFARLF